MGVDSAIGGKDVVIVGAGLGGLLLARLLYVQGITFTVLEKEPSRAFRTQGGTLDIHGDTGQRALQQAGLFDAFVASARYEDQGLRAYRKDGVLLRSFDGQAMGSDRPEIDRGELRDLLLNSLPDDAVQWGCELSDIFELPGGSLRVELVNGTHFKASFLVGADGSRSKVRPCVGLEEPIYTGETMYELIIDDVDGRHPAIASMVGHGMLVAGDDAQRLFAQRTGAGEVRIYAALQRADRGTRETKASILAEFSDWGEQLRSILHAAGDTVRPWPIDTMPADRRWRHRLNVTLLGDAAHVMAPNGEGANLALTDAADLAQALSCKDGREAAVAAFEQKMMARAECSSMRHRERRNRG